MIRKSIEPDEWQGCYDEGWKGLIVDEAFAHPAKMSYSLVARIYEHAFKSGWLKPGDTVVDPFGGIAGTALHAAIQGVRWVGCELEPRFKELGNQNIDLWQSMYGAFPEWVRPTLHCGDSRELCKVLGYADGCIGSPPFVDARQDTTASRKGVTAPTRHDPEDWGAAVVVSSPPFAVQQTGGGIAANNGTNGNVKTGTNCGYQNQGATPGQLGGMKEGDIDAVLTSPPYATGTVHDGNGIDQSKLTGNKAGKNSQAKAQGYGDSDGQLSAMVVGSPPFEASIGHDGGKDHMPNIGNFGASYGDSAGNIGNDSGETFWSSARIIVEQCHTILKPGGVAIFVCKDFVRKGKRVPFSDQWLALCEAVGFRAECRHRAMLVKRGDVQKLLLGGTEQKVTERKSFFRRLAEKKGSPRIDWEDVICVRK